MKTQYRVTSNGIDFRIQRLEEIWFGLSNSWEDIWSHGDPVTYTSLADANKEVDDYIEQARIRKLKYTPVTTIIS